MYILQQYLHFSRRFPVSSENLPFLKVFPSIVIYPLLMLMSWNLTTRCLAVTGGGSVGDEAD